MIYDLFNRTLLACETIIENCEKVSNAQKEYDDAMFKIRKEETNLIVREAKINEFKEGNENNIDTIRTSVAYIKNTILDLRSFISGSSSSCLEELRDVIKQIVSRNENPLPPVEEMQLYPDKTGKYFGEIDYDLVAFILKAERTYDVKATRYLKAIKEPSFYTIRHFISMWENGKAIRKFQNAKEVIDIAIEKSLDMVNNDYVYALREVKNIFTLIYVSMRTEMQNYQILYKAFSEYLNSPAQYSL